VNGSELWKSDGTEAGTVMVADITGDFASSYPSDMTLANNVLFFAAQTRATGNELYMLRLAPTPPFAGEDTVTTTRDVPAGIITNELLQNDWNVDGASVAFAGVATTSSYGGTVSRAGNLVVYTPPAGFSGLDSFSYTITNGGGGAAQGTVKATVLDTLNPLHHIQATRTTNGLLLSFTGIPGDQYQLESATNIDAEIWIKLQNLYIDANGVIQLGLTNVPSPNFFRLKKVNNSP
jgi:ELWxxDGT repeat protein